MNKEDIIRMAKEGGIYHGFDSEDHWDGLLDFQLIERRQLSKESIIYGENRMFEILKRFAALVAAAEREACTKVCERMWHEWLDSPEENEPNKPDAEDCYKAIRARGQA